MPAGYFTIRGKRRLLPDRSGFVDSPQESKMKEEIYGTFTGKFYVGSSDADCYGSGNSPYR